MLVSQCMSRAVRMVAPEQTLQDAARMMLDADIGALVVGSQNRVAGILTDRDIAVRAVARGLRPEAQVSEVMSAGDIVVAYDDQDLDQVAALMCDRKVRRLPVLERASGRLCGVLSLGDLARTPETATAETALAGVAQAGGEHSQTAEVTPGRAS